MFGFVSLPPTIFGELLSPQIFSALTSDLSFTIGLFSVSHSFVEGVVETGLRVGTVGWRLFAEEDEEEEEDEEDDPEDPEDELEEPEEEAEEEPEDPEDDPEEEDDEEYPYEYALVEWVE